MVDFFHHFIEKSDEVLNAMNDIKGESEKSDSFEDFNENAEEKSGLLCSPLPSGKDLMKISSYSRKSKRNMQISIKTIKYYKKMRESQRKCMIAVTGLFQVNFLNFFIFLIFLNFFRFFIILLFLIFFNFLQFSSFSSFSSIFFSIFFIFLHFSSIFFIFLKIFFISS